MPSFASFFTSLLTFQTGGDNGEPFTSITHETSKTSIITSGSVSVPMGPGNTPFNFGTTVNPSPSNSPDSSTGPWVSEYHQPVMYNSSNVTNGTNITNTTYSTYSNGTNTTSALRRVVVVLPSTFAFVNQTDSLSNTTAILQGYNMSTNTTGAPQKFSTTPIASANYVINWDNATSTTGAPKYYNAEQFENGFYNATANNTNTTSTRRRVVAVLPSNFSSVNETDSWNNTTVVNQGYNMSTNTTGAPQISSTSPVASENYGINWYNSTSTTGAPEYYIAAQFENGFFNATANSTNTTSTRRPFVAVLPSNFSFVNETDSWNNITVMSQAYNMTTNTTAAPQNHSTSPVVTEYYTRTAYTRTAF